MEKWDSIARVHQVPIIKIFMIVLGTLLMVFINPDNPDNHFPPSIRQMIGGKAPKPVRGNLWGPKKKFYVGGGKVFIAVAVVRNDSQDIWTL